MTIELNTDQLQLILINDLENYKNGNEVEHFSKRVAFLINILEKERCLTGFIAKIIKCYSFTFNTYIDLLNDLDKGKHDNLIINLLSIYNCDF